MARPRRYRSLPEKTGSVVLGFEAIVVFLAGLVMYGLDALPGAVPSWWGIVVGSVLLVALLVVSGSLRWTWGRVAGWVLQIVIAAGALLVPAILLVAVVFGAMWAYAMIGGARIERRVQQARQANEDTPGA